ncbi:MAG: SUMF1/EgtB/PvdO family nonheme iron enzyme [Treponema sp.]|nr:SUMF1/EgtB/PvdO family nonheme iron enzyme [Treponema sp.]
MTRRIGKFLFHSTFSALALALGLLLSACSGGTNYVGTGTTQAPAATGSCTVTFETNGGSAVTAQTVESGKTASEPTAPTKDGFTFGGWYTDSALTGVFSFSTAITSNTTLYAKWISAAVPTFEVTFETNGGSAVTKQVVASGGVAVLPSASPTKTGSEFIGWYADSGFSIKYNFTTPITADTTVYARWWDATDFVLADGKIVGETTGSNVFVSGRTVTTSTLWASNHEVTQGEYETYCKYGNFLPSATDGIGANYPAYYVSWYDALVYCNKRSIAEGLTPCYTIGGSTNPASWPGVVDDGAGKHCGPASSNADWYAATCNFSANGYRLPTEAEWEWLARGGDPAAAAWEQTYSGSDTIDDVAWYTTNSGSTAHEVKQKAANSKGLYDMSGNVWEWCWDWWYRTITATTPASGAASGSRRVIRGGAWNVNASLSAMSYRVHNSPPTRYHDCGFRVVRTAE